MDKQLQAAEWMLKQYEEGKNVSVSNLLLMSINLSLREDSDKLNVQLLIKRLRNACR